MLLTCTIKEINRLGKERYF